MSKKTKKQKKVIYPHETQKWEELEAMYAEIANGIIEISNNIAISVSTINQHSMENDTELVSTVNGFNKDILQFTDELVAIHDKHKGKVGIITDPDELAECINIFHDYVSLFEKFKSLTFNSNLLVTEKLADLVSKLKDSVISDAEIIEDVSKEKLNG